MKFSSQLVVPFLCLAALSASTTNGFFVNEDDVVKGMDPMCPTVQHYTAVYHENTACDRAQQNLFKETLNRHATQMKLQAQGTNAVPSELTSFCPQTVSPLTSSESTTGFDTVWLVENTATTPVVVAHMLEQADGSFKEVSAFDSSISPPNHDPKAILQPQEWKSLQTYEGHVFHVREIMKDGNMGQVLMQHRVGLIAVTNKYGHELNCDPVEPDLEPVVEVAPGQVDRDPNFAREAPRTMRPCNVLDIGFRNEVGCPLNAYYTGMYQMKGVAKPRGSLRSFEGNVANGHTPKSCHEVFKFHLGLQEKTNNFMFDWNSKTKYEGTYVGHNFVFRYAKDERIVVDSIALHPTRVIDCPGLKNQVNVASATAGEAIITPVMHADDEAYLLPHKAMMGVKNWNATAADLNATEWALSDMPSPSQRRRARAALRAAGGEASSRTATVLTQSL